MPTQFLKPKSVDEPYQGAFQYRPLVRVFDEASPAALETAMTTALSIQEVDPTRYIVVEQIQYETYVTVPPMPVNRFTCMVWYTEVEVI